jgi:hypothetical protein
MKNTSQINSNPGAIACAIAKVHNCADCPIRLLAVKQPQSVFARLHTWHMTWWPGWKAHKAFSAAAKTQS